MKVVDYWKKFWGFLQEDSWASFAVTLILAFVIIKFVFFPGLSLITGTSLPLVIVESCSMYHHEDGFENTFESDSYEDYGLSLADTGNWIFQNGFSKGDVIFVVGAGNVEVGDVIIFNGGEQHPLIHRVVEVDDAYTTKGDNNPAIYPFDRNIDEDQLIGKALFKVPFIGWAKLIFFEGGKADYKRGLC
jgi:signal peptidase I